MLSTLAGATSTDDRKVLRVVPGVVSRVVDGDTVLVTLDLGWRITRLNESVRVANVSCPELRLPAGVAAARHAASLLPPGTACDVHVLQWQEKYGRTLARLSFLLDGTPMVVKDFGDEMIAAGYGRPGDGRQGLVESLFHA